MRVLYNTCVADPFVYVAKQMEKEYGFEAVYWIGYDNDGSEDLVQKLLPNACYHPWRDAWKAIFPSDVAAKVESEHLDIDLLRENALNELLAMKMMDRLDGDRYSFNFMERERHYLKLFRGWMACFDLYKPDIVVTGVNPHRIYDYVLYIVCKYRKVPFVSFQHTLCPQRTFCTNGIFTVGDTFDKSLEHYLSIAGSLTKEDLSEEIRLPYEKVVKDYSEAIPVYMKQHNVDNRKNANLFYLAKKGLTKYSILNRKDKTLSKGELSLKKRNISLEKSRFSLFDMASMRISAIKYKKELSKLYNSLVSLPVENEKYILFPLHYQPEESTSPSGDIFVNQLLAVDAILNNTPEDYYIYVKEHPQSFQNHLSGHKSRIKEFYTDLISSKRVRLMPLEMNTYQLMQGAKAVTTITGTVGWEAVMHKLPVIIFGFVWYEKMPGVLRITDSKSATGIMSFIENYKFDEHNVLAYLKAYQDNTVYAYHYFGQKETTNIDTEACADTLAKYLKDRLVGFLGDVE